MDGCGYLNALVRTVTEFMLIASMVLIIGYLFKCTRKRLNSAKCDNFTKRELAAMAKKSEGAPPSNLAWLRASRMLRYSSEHHLAEIELQSKNLDTVENWRRVLIKEKFIDKEEFIFYTPKMVIAAQFCYTDKSTPEWVVKRPESMIGGGSKMTSIDSVWMAYAPTLPEYQVNPMLDKMRAVDERGSYVVSEFGV